MKLTTLDLFYQLFKPFIFKLDLDAETMHNLALKQIRKIRPPKEECNRIYELFGHKFFSPLILAAGFDKEGILIDNIQNLGFAFEVVGSITAKGYEGNKKPRVWRIPKRKALLNKMGLNSKPAEQIAECLERKTNYALSIAKTPNIKGDKAIDDVVTSYNLLRNLGIYTEIDISCPSIDDKTFENPSDLELLLDSLSKKEKPLLIKISPNLNYENLQGIVEISKDKIDGYVATNTLPCKHGQFGNVGVSGVPLQEYSLTTIKNLRKLTNKIIIGCGGIFSGKDAYNFLSAGADFLQAYTAFIYRGPLFAFKLNSELKFYRDTFINP